MGAWTGLKARNETTTPTKESKMEHIHLWNVEGTARKSGEDFNGNKWMEFEVDPLAEQLPGKCCICGTELENGWTCLDGGDEVCSDHIMQHDGEVPEYPPFTYEFKHLTSWGSQMDGDGGLDSWENFGPSEPREWYYRHSIVYGYAPAAGDILSESNFECILRDLRNKAESPENVFETSVGHWTYPSFSLIVVKLYNEEGQPTPEAIYADEIRDELNNEAIWDDADYYERESNALFEFIQGCGVSEDKVGDIVSALGELGLDCHDTDGSIWVSEEDLDKARREVLIAQCFDPDSLIQLANELGIQTEGEEFIELAEDLGFDLVGIPSAYFDSNRWDAKLSAWASGDRIGIRAGDIPWPPTIEA